MEQYRKLIDKYFKKEASVAEKEYLLEYLSRPDISNNDLADVWNRTHGVIPKTVDERLWKAINRKITDKHSYDWKTMFCWVAAFFVFVFATSSVYLYHKINRLSRYDNLIVEVGKGQKSDVKLPDGTKVQLNSDSKLIYGKTFNEKERTVELIGEAYFEVAKHQAPFCVKTGKIVVQALGTVFNIKAYPGDKCITTFLANGKVRLNSGNETVMLSPGEVAEFSTVTNRMKKKEVDDPGLYISWIKNQLFFKDEKLEDIIRLLERSYHVKFNILDPSLKKHPFSGTLQNSSLLNILEILSLSANLKYKINNNEIEISRK